MSDSSPAGPWRSYSNGIPVEIALTEDGTEATLRLIGLGITLRMSPQALRQHATNAHNALMEMRRREAARQLRGRP